MRALFSPIETQERKTANGHLHHAPDPLQHPGAVCVSTFLAFIFVSYAGNPVANLRSNPQDSGQHDPQRHRPESSERRGSDPLLLLADATYSRTSSAARCDELAAASGRRSSNALGHTAQVVIHRLGRSRSSSAAPSASTRRFGSTRSSTTRSRRLAFLGFAMPTFVLALLLQFLFVDIYNSWHVRIFYTASLNSPGTSGAWSLDRMQHIALPVITLAIDQFCRLQPLHARLDARRDQQRLRAHRAS